ncbi:glycerophosphodiester phosphodiesterase [Arthrobacter terrae]|nr:glycerophosphodiester phosphodiesterase family protein [Arthrobacter terrae]
MMPLIYAHRGSSAHFAEHTRAAYLQAIADGADGVECDLQLSADGELVLLHDETVDRTSNGSGPLAQQTLAQLQELDFCSWKDATVPLQYGSVREQLLTLEALLDILSGAGRQIGLAIEFKYAIPQAPADRAAARDKTSAGDRSLEERTLQVLRARGWQPEDSRAGNIVVSFMSFNPDSMRHLAATIPGRSLCALLEDVAVEDDLAEDADGDTPAAMLRSIMAAGERLIDDAVTGLAGPGVAYVRAHPDRVRHWADAGTRLRIWTVNDTQDARFCLSLGVHELTTDAPAGLRAALTR